MAICSRYNVTDLPGDEPRCYVKCNCDFVTEAGKNKKKEKKEKKKEGNERERREEKGREKRIPNDKYHINLITLH